MQDIQNRAREVFCNVHCSVVMNLDTLRTDRGTSLFLFLFLSLRVSHASRRVASRTLVSFLAHSVKEGVGQMRDFCLLSSLGRRTFPFLLSLEPQCAGLIGALPT